MHKAAATLQFKLEGQLLSRHPEYGMNNRRLLDHIDFEKRPSRLTVRNTRFAAAISRQSTPTIRMR